MPFYHLKLMLFILLALVGLTSEATAASGRAVRSITSITVLQGECRKFIAYSTAADGCSNKLANAEYNDHRLVFTFQTTETNGSVATLSFSGAGAKQVHRDADTVLQPIDHILMNFDGKTDELASTGQCGFSNPYKGRAIVNCSVNTKMGQFTGVFYTDGTEPKTLDLDR